MKKDIHPKTKKVVFKDLSSGFQILTSSTIETKQTTEFEGKTYPMVPFDISSSSHPFYTGKQRLLDTEGRAKRFMNKYKNFSTSSQSKD
ncbi:MAG: type B 50S ribosomal protein L31 [Bdellovibrionales bacterium]|nr:type B 50S ribosomal protein L31 [Bdellovibrionales bacterium]